MLRKIMISGENTRYNADLQSRLGKLLPEFLVTSSNEFQKAIETDDKVESLLWLNAIVEYEDLYDEQFIIIPIVRNDREMYYNPDWRERIVKFANDLIRPYETNSKYKTRVLLVDIDKDVNYIARILTAHIDGIDEIHRAIMSGGLIKMDELKIIEMVNND